MRHHATATSISWIPSEAVGGINKAMFGTGFTHYDDPPPEAIDDLEQLRGEDRFRFANRLEGWIEVDDAGAIVDAGHAGGCLMGATTIAVGGARATFAAVALPDLRPEITIADGSARFVQTVGGHTALPAPRRVKKPPFVQFEAPTVWTTLALTIHADGSSEHELIGASKFPRHWVYGDDGTLSAKAGLADFKEWWQHSFGRHTPWGDQDSEVLVTEVESALERQVAGMVMRGGEKVRTRPLKAGDLLTEQGEAGDELFLLLNGVLSMEVDGEPLAEVGPGAILGERALLEGGTRTATLRAITKANVAVARRDQVDHDLLAEISQGHRREMTG